MLTELLLFLSPLPFVSTVLLLLTPVGHVEVRPRPDRAVIERMPWGIRARLGRRRAPVPEGWQVDWPRWYGPVAIHADGRIHHQVRRRREWLLSASFTAVTWACLIWLWGSTLQWVQVVAPGGEVVGHRILAPFFNSPLPPAPIGECDLVTDKGLALLAWNGGRLTVDTGTEQTLVVEGSLPTFGLSADQFRGVLLHEFDVLEGFGAGPPWRTRYAVLSGWPTCAGLLEQQVVLGPEMPGSDGIFGMGPLIGRIVEIDLAHLQLRIDADLGPARARYPWVTDDRAIRLDGEPTEVLAAGRAGDQPIRLRVDTGAYSTTVRKGLTRPIDPDRPKRRVSMDGGIGLQGAIGKIPVKRLPSLCVGDVCWSDLLVDEEHVPGDLDVNLGIDALWGRALVLDLVDRRLWIGPFEGLPPGLDDPEAKRREKVEEALRKFKE